MKNFFMGSMDCIVQGSKLCDIGKTAIVHPTSADALEGVLAAASLGVLEPVLVGPVNEMERVAKENSFDISAFEKVATGSPEESASKAALLAGTGAVDLLMKGNLHTDVMMRAVLDVNNNLRTGRLLSHCAFTIMPSYSRHVILTDIALNIEPTIEQKKEIIINAVMLARALGVEVPKVALIAAVETVELKMRATTDAAILAKMADRRQIKHCIVEGPIDLDAAVDLDAAQVKGINSPVAGYADILVMPDINSANTLYKALVFMANAQMADVIVGARVPIILTSRADSAEIRVYSIAVARLFAEALRNRPCLLNE